MRPDADEGEKRTNEIGSPRNDPNESGRTMIACRESATKIRTNLPWFQQMDDGSRT